jgi:hypothetical protein
MVLDEKDRKALLKVLMEYEEMIFTSTIYGEAKRRKTVASLIAKLNPPKSGQKGKCRCGKLGEFIADGICRHGFYCKNCSDEAIKKG